MEIFVNLAGAVALLLWGIRTVRTGVERLFGSRIEAHVAVLTGRRFSAFGLGIGTAFSLQSATAVSLMAASFCAGGVLTLPAGLATALGAEVGSSLAVAMLNLDVKVLAPLLLFVGFVTFTASGGRRGKHVGRITLGFAFILTALTLLSSATQALAAGDAARDIMRILSAEPLALVIVTMLLTWLMHSSIAVVLMIAQLVANGGLPQDGGLWMVIGANAGAALPALISGWTLGGRARQLLLGAVGLRLIGVAIGALLLSVPALAALPPVQYAGTHVVLAHLALNVTAGILLLPLVGIVAKVVQVLLPPVVIAADPDRVTGHMFLAPEDVSRPQTAFLNIANETSRVAHIVFGMIGGISELFRDPEADARIKALEADVDRLYREVTLYMASIKLDDLDEDERNRWFELFEFITHLEHVGDIITRNITDLAKRKRKTGLEFSPDGANELDGLTSELSDIFRHAQAVFLSRDKRRAQDLVTAKRRFRTHTLESQRRHAMRLSSGVKTSVASSRIHLDLLRELQRINSHLTAVAYPLLKEPS
ncbi:Na/Pi cotransporter family protein [Acuticoccus sp. MNP-M23]|uniref:Na/Pi cotransporter family protein n=1 Tax=Acuticoccus sp. MNP-M23 TaxID=3072793 RepID=UPI0028167FB6|nr:Na/Pi cotransporter family protein [Acuticoccus sp. MNP-M23]WMS42655.1 Na/Pi cotransporter family protein [Acuticoccus sp. MNP-M23]